MREEDQVLFSNRPVFAQCKNMNDLLHISECLASFLLKPLMSRYEEKWHRWPEDDER
jgi:hypothetical protein